MTESVEISLLGSLEVRRGGEPVPLPGARLRRLLAILAVEANRVVPADRIVDSLWSDEASPTATGALHVLVSRLRNTIEPDRRARDAASLVVTVPPGYRLQVARAQIDALRFEDEVGLGREALAARRWQDAVAILDGALGRWRGPALAEFAEELFALAAVGRWEELRNEADEDRIEALLALGRHNAEVVGELETLVAAAPYRERRTGQLMRALYRAGRQADALRAYERLRRTLADELGLLPSPELQRLEHAVLLQEDTLTLPGAEGPPSPGLIGRRAELDTMRHALAGAASDGHHIVLVSGEPGIGKTATLRWFSLEAQSSGADVWWGTCAEGVGAGPYRPWVDALDTGGVTWPRVAASDSSARGDLLRNRLFDAITLAATMAAAVRPLVIVLDDLHWADVPSLRLLESMATSLGTAPVLLVVAYRESAATGAQPLAGTVKRLRARGVATPVPLARLPVDAVADLVESMTGERVPALIDLLYARTGGNPLFVRELVRLLAASGDLDEVAKVGLGSAAVPRTVRAMVEGLFGRLSADGREVVAAAAVAGRELDAELLASITDGDDPLRDAAIREALAAGLLSEDPHQPGRFSFSHDLVREAVYHELSPTRRARLHRRIGEVLEAALARGEPVEAADLAHHFVAAARGGDPAKAVQYAIRAAEAATAALAYEEAVVQYERAFEAGAAIDPVDRTELLLALGDARWRAGGAIAARETFLDAGYEARHLRRPELLTRAVLGFGGGFFRTWHATFGAFGQRPTVLLEEALAAVGSLDDGERARVLGLLAEELYFAFDDRRYEVSEEAVAIAREVGDPATLAVALSSRSLAVWDPDHVEERCATADEIIDIGDSLGRAEISLSGLACRLVGELELGDAMRADATLERFEDAAHQLRQPMYLWEARWLRAMEALFRGRFAEAERVAVDALEIGRRTGDPDADSIFAVQLGVLRFEQGRTDEVEEDVRAQADEIRALAAWRAGLCLAVAEEGHLEDAAAELDRVAPDRFAAFPKDFAWLAAMVMLSEACALIGDRRRAAVLYDLLLPYAGRNAMTADRNCWGSVAHYLGVLATLLERSDDAVHWCEQAIDANLAMGATPWVAHSQHGLARALALRGRPSDRARAGDLTAAAERTATELGMERLLRRIRRDTDTLSREPVH